MATFDVQRELSDVGSSQLGPRMPCCGAANLGGVCTKTDVS